MKQNDGKYDVHPVVPLYTLMCLTVAVQYMNITVIFSFLVFMVISGISLYGMSSFKLIGRLRFLLIIMFVFHAWGVGGEKLWPYLQSFSPTREGVELACIQLARWLLILVSVSIYLCRTRPEAIAEGLNALLLPLKSFSLDVDRFTIRILLTLKYAEQIINRPDIAKLSGIEERLDEFEISHTSFTLKKVILGWREGLIMLAMTILLGGICL